MKHKVEHLIEAAKYRRLDPARLVAAKKEFLELEKQGIVRRSCSQWASPSTWCARRMGRGGRAVTSGGSTSRRFQTGTPTPTWPT